MVVRWRGSPTVPSVKCLREKKKPLFVVLSETSAGWNCPSSKKVGGENKKEICPKIAIQSGKLHCNCTVGTRYIWQQAPVRGPSKPEARRAACRPSLAIVKGIKQGGQLRLGVGTPSPTHLRERPGQEQQLGCIARSPPVTPQTLSV